MNLKKSLLIFSITFIISYTSSCTFKILPTYDPETAAQIIETAAEVERFFLEMLDTPAELRVYEKFSNEYRSIESDLSMLVLRNQMRPLNDESIKIAQNTLEIFKNIRTLHKDRSAKSNLPAGSLSALEASQIMNDFVINEQRKFMLDNFSLMAIAERAKQMPENEGGN